MANTITITKLIDGPRKAYFKVYLASDGVAGEINRLIIVDPATSISPPKLNKPTFTLVQAWYSLVGFDVQIEFEDTLPTQNWKFPAASDSNHIDFSDFGGLKDQSSNSTGTGRILLSTNGFTTSDKQGQLILALKKD